MLIDIDKKKNRQIQVLQEKVEYLKEKLNNNSTSKGRNLQTLSHAPSSSMLKNVPSSSRHQTLDHSESQKELVILNDKQLSQ